MGFLCSTMTVRELHLLYMMCKYTQCIKKSDIGIKLFSMLYAWSVLEINIKNKKWKEPSDRTRLL